MAIALPPPAAPQFEPIETFVAHAPRQAFHIKHQQMDLWLYGFDDARSDTLTAVIRDARDAQQVVVALATHLYLNDAVQDRLIYSKNENMVFVLRQHRRVTGYEGPDELRAYFDDLLQRDSLSLESFEQARLLASQYSDRTGTDYAVSLKAINASDVVLALTPQVGRRSSPLAVELGVDNYGSRYAGENATSANITVQPGGGYALNLGGRTSPESLNRNATAGQLFQVHGGTNRITPIGYIGVSGRLLKFELDNSAGGVTTGEFVEYAADWTGVSGITLDSRRTTQLRIAFTDQQTVADSGSAAAKDGLLPGPSDPNPELPLPSDPDLPPPDPGLEEPLNELTDRSPESASTSNRNSDQSGSPGFRESYMTAEISPGWSGGTRVPYALSIRLKYATAAALSLSGADETLALAQPALSLGGPGTRLSLDVAGQFTNGVAPEFLQWTLGGPARMSAYTSGAANGDSGYHARATLTPWRSRAGRVRTGLHLFAETAAAQRSADGARTVLHDAGVRLRFEIGRNLSIEAVSAVPLAETAIVDLSEFHASWFANFKLGF